MSNTYQAVKNIKKDSLPIFEKYFIYGLLSAGIIFAGVVVLTSIFILLSEVLGG